MSDDLLSKLNQAYEHVEAGRLDEAIAILQPVLDANPENADAWWIYMHSVSDPQEARRALSNVMRIAPDYPGATDMLGVLDTQYPTGEPLPPAFREAEQRPSVRPITPPPMSMPEAPAEMPERPSAPPPVTQRGMPSPFEPTAQTGSSPTSAVPQARRRSPISTLIVAAIVIVALILVVILLNPGAQSSETTTSTVAPTNLAVVSTDTSIPIQVIPSSDITKLITATTAPTLENTEPAELVTEPVVEPTEPTLSSAETEEPIAEVTQEVNPAVTEESVSLDTALSAFTLAPAGITTETLSTGTTVLANVCSAPGREARTLLPQVMEVLASATAGLPDDVEGIGTRLVNCENSNILVTVAVERTVAAQFAAGDLTSGDFSARWTAIR